MDLEKKFQHWLYDPAERQYKGVGNVKIVDIAEPGYYDIKRDNWGNPVMNIVDIRQDAHYKFDNGPYKLVLDEVSQFWGSSLNYDLMGVSHKRGVLLHGAPGCGKSGIINGVIQDTINRNGVVFALEPRHLDHFIDGIPLFRQVQPDTPVMAVLEDVEEVFDCGYESDLLELLDGTSSVCNNILYLMTTNYLEKVPTRIRARPSRVDTLIEISYPCAMQRAEYVKFLLTKQMPENDFIEKVVDLSAGMSLADLKEVLIGTFIYKRDLEECVGRLKANKTACDESSEEDEDCDDEEAESEDENCKAVCSKSC